jgi:tetratricopeptide (TPR) repeat protein
MDESSTLAQRYGQTAAGEWQRVLNHFTLGEGFALIILVVPDRDGAQLCRNELERLLAAQGSLLIRQEPATPGELIQLSSSLLDKELTPRAGAIWIAAVLPQSAPDFHDWEDAWRRTLEGLNQQRNPLRRRFEYPLIIVTAPWVVPLFRDVAPDLWSVRSQVVRIEPDREFTRRRSDEIRQVSPPVESPPPTDTPDPELALREAERLRGIPGRERQRAEMLMRAGRGLYSQEDLQGAEAVLREAADLLAIAADIAANELSRRTRARDRAAAERTLRETLVSRGETVHELGRALRDQGRAAEAEESFRQALALEEEGGATAVSRGITMHELGRALLDQGLAAEGEESFRRALALAEEGGATAVSRGITMHGLGLALQDQGRAVEAEETFRRSLALREVGGATAVSRGITMHELGRALRDQGRVAEAEESFRRALALKEEGGDTAVSRGITMGELGRALLDQGRAAEAEETFRRALALGEEGGDTAVSRSITMEMLGRALLDQGRAAEAEETFRRALALGEEGGDTAVSLGITMDNLGRALRDQGLVEEAEEALRRALALREQGT